MSEQNGTEFFLDSAILILITDSAGLLNGAP